MCRNNKIKSTDTSHSGDVRDYHLKIPTHTVRSYDIAIGDLSWNLSLPHRFNKCHSLMPILATTGIEKYSVNIHLLKTEVSHVITVDDRLLIT
jgi:hypothetical protein